MLTLLIIDKKQLKMGIAKEMEEHGMSEQEAHKTAIDHIKENPRYYSIADSVRLEDEKIVEGSQIQRMNKVKLPHIPSRTARLKKQKGQPVGAGKIGPTGAGVGY